MPREIHYLAIPRLVPTAHTDSNESDSTPVTCQIDPDHNLDRELFRADHLPPHPLWYVLGAVVLSLVSFFLLIGITVGIEFLYARKDR